MLEDLVKILRSQIHKQMQVWYLRCLS